VAAAARRRYPITLSDVNASKSPTTMIATIIRAIVRDMVPLTSKKLGKTHLYDSERRAF